MGRTEASPPASSASTGPRAGTPSPCEQEHPPRPRPSCSAAHSRWRDTPFVRMSNELAGFQRTLKPNHFQEKTARHKNEVPFCQHGGVLRVFLEGIHAKPAAQKGDKRYRGKATGNADDRRGGLAAHGSGEDTAAGTGAYRGLMGGLLFPAVIFIRSKWLVYSCVCVAFSSCAYIWPVRRGRLFLLWNGRARAQLSGGGPADGARGRARD